MRDVHLTTARLRGTVPEHEGHLLRMTPQRMHRHRPRAALTRLRTVVTSVAAATAVALSGAVAAPAAAATPTPDEDAWYVLVNRQSGLALDVKGASRADGAQLVQQTRKDTTDQQFRFVEQSDGTYVVVARHSGKALDVWEWSTESGGELRQFTQLGGANQRFDLVGSRIDRMRLVNEHSGLAVGVTDRSKAAGATITQAADRNQYNQQWSLVEVGDAPATAPTTPTTGVVPATWPRATDDVKVTSTRKVTTSFDGKLQRFYGISKGDQDESQPAMFELADGAVLKNVIIGTGAGDGVHCLGTCTLQNVWWEDVGEDAATFKGTKATQTFTIDGGGARKAEDKVFQHNGPGTFVIRNFEVSDFGKLYRSCGNCSKQYERHVVIENVRVVAPAVSVVGINTNYGDTATITNLTIANDGKKKLPVCEWYQGILKSKGGDAKKIGNGPNASCLYSPAAITYE